MAPFAFLFMRTGREGAQNIIHAVLEEDSYFKVISRKKWNCKQTAENKKFFPFQSGYFYRDFQLATRENKRVDENMEISAQFWALSEEVTKLK